MLHFCQNLMFCFPWGFLHSSVGKESACNAGDPSWIPGLGWSTGEGIGYPLQYPGLENSMDCSPPGSSAHGILRARILEWVAYPFSRRSSQPRNPTGVSCIAGRFFTSWAIGKSNFRPSRSHSHLSNRVAPDCYYLELPTEFMQSNFNMYPLPWSGDLTEGFNNPG